MNIDFREFLRQAIWLLGCFPILILLKSVILLVLGRLFQLSWPASIEVVCSGPGGVLRRKRWDATTAD
jgi:CPA2 family monovalent cation:H+ antiporter-2